MSNIKDHILSLIAGVPFAVIAVIAVILILRAIHKIKRKAVGAGMLFAGICLFCPSLYS